MGPITPPERKPRLRLDLRKNEKIVVRRGCVVGRTCYNVRMSNKNNNGNNPARTIKTSRKGPRPIQTVAQLRENLLRDALTREMRKIDRKIAVHERKRKIAHQRAADATAALDALAKIRAEFLRESGIKA